MALQQYIQASSVAGSKLSPRETLEEKLQSATPANRIFLTRPEVAEYLGVSTKTLDVKANKEYHNLPYSLVGGRSQYKLSDVLDYFDSKRKGGEV